MLKSPPKSIPSQLTSDIKSISEERANMISHAVGLLLYIIVSPFIIIHAYQTQNKAYFLGAIIYVIGLLMVYTSSTLYHNSYNIVLRRRLRIFDHISIYFLIAGTYTPFLLSYFQDSLGYSLLIIIWSMVFIGSIFKLFFTHRFKLISTAAYLIMGWLAIFIIEPVMERLPSITLTWIVIGGLSYSIGVIFYLRESMKYNHFIWHLFVLMGSTAHLIAVYRCFG